MEKVKAIGAIEKMATSPWLDVALTIRKYRGGKGVDPYRYCGHATAIALRENGRVPNIG